MDAFDAYMIEQGLDLLVTYVMVNEADSLEGFDDVTQLASTCFFVCDLFEDALNKHDKVCSDKLELSPDTINLITIELDSESHTFVVMVEENGRVQ